MVANTAPVAFGALAVPITTLAGVTGLSVDDLGAMVGRQTPLLALFVPLALVFIVDGKRGMRQMWPPAYGQTLDQLKFAILTVMLLLGLGFIMSTPVLDWMVVGD